MSIIDQIIIKVSAGSGNGIRHARFLKRVSGINSPYIDNLSKTIASLRQGASPSIRDVLPCIRVAPSSPLSYFCCPLAELCFRATVLLSYFSQVVPPVSTTTYHRRERKSSTFLKINSGFFHGAFSLTSAMQFLRIEGVDYIPIPY